MGKRGPKPKGIDDYLNVRISAKDRVDVEAFSIQDGFESTSDWIRNLIQQERLRREQKRADPLA